MWRSAVQVCLGLPLSIDNGQLIILSCGGLAQLARAPALQAGGQRFESVILHVVRQDRRSQSWTRHVECGLFSRRSLTFWHKQDCSAGFSGPRPPLEVPGWRSRPARQKQRRRKQQDTQEYERARPRQRMPGARLKARLRPAVPSPVGGR